jgi:hypothetical protein
MRCRFEDLLRNRPAGWVPHQERRRQLAEVLEGETMSKPRTNPRPVLPAIHPSPEAIRMLRRRYGDEWKVHTVAEVERWLDSRATGEEVHVMIDGNDVENLAGLTPSERTVVNRTMEAAGIAEAVRILEGRQFDAAREIDPEILRAVLAEIDKAAGAAPDPAATVAPPAPEEPKPRIVRRGGRP